VAVPVRRDDLGLVEVAVPADTPDVELEHRAGPAESVGAGLSLLGLAMLALVGLRRSRA
jgi:hypothetical protein